jgi:hypothetical protein
MCDSPYLSRTLHGHRHWHGPRALDGCRAFSARPCYGGSLAGQEKAETVGIDFVPEIHGLVRMKPFRHSNFLKDCTNLDAVDSRTHSSRVMQGYQVHDSNRKHCRLITLQVCADGIQEKQGDKSSSISWP